MRVGSEQKISWYLFDKSKRITGPCVRVIVQIELYYYHLRILQYNSGRSHAQIHNYTEQRGSNEIERLKKRKENNAVDENSNGSIIYLVLNKTRIFRGFATKYVVPVWPRQCF